MQTEQGEVFVLQWLAKLEKTLKKADRVSTSRDIDPMQELTSCPS